MNSKFSSLDAQKIAELIDSARNITAFSLKDAAATDKENLFPEKTLKRLIKSGFLTAALPTKFGGLNLGLIPHSNEALLTIFKIIGRGNLVMGRILEGHINAQLLIEQFGSKKQRKKFASDAHEGKLFSIWNTQAQDGTKMIKENDDTYTLKGSKIFATGSGYVTRPIVTAALPNGAWQMCVVPLNETLLEFDSSWWHPLGMRASRSYKVTFNKAVIPKNNLIGKGGNYYQQPGFGSGAVRFAAIQLGAAEMLLDLTRKYLQSLGRTNDPYQKIRLGEMAILIESGNQWLKGAANQMDAYMLNSTEPNSNRLLIYINMMRTAVEKICLEVMILCQKCVGARGLNKPYHFERIIRDLTTYLRQPAPDATLADVGQYVLNSEVSSDIIWQNSQSIKKSIK